MLRPVDDEGFRETCYRSRIAATHKMFGSLIFYGLANVSGVLDGMNTIISGTSSVSFVELQEAYSVVHSSLSRRESDFRRIANWGDFNRSVAIMHEAINARICWQANDCSNNQMFQHSRRAWAAFIAHCRMEPPFHLADVLVDKIVTRTTLKPININKILGADGLEFV